MVENNGVAAKGDGKVVAKSHNSNSNSPNKGEQSLKSFPKKEPWVRPMLLYHRCQR